MLVPASCGFFRIEHALKLFQVFQLRRPLNHRMLDHARHLGTDLPRWTPRLSHLGDVDHMGVNASVRDFSSHVITVLIEAGEGFRLDPKIAIAALGGDIKSAADSPDGFKTSPKTSAS